MSDLHPMPAEVLGQALTIGNVNFKNRLLRSSVGGRNCNYDGSVTDVWKNFEKRFAQGGVGGIISTTFHVNQSRLAPLQYPSIALQRHVFALKKFLPEIREEHGTRYIVQIGDPGYATYSSLFPEDTDGLSASDGFDFAFGYTNRRRAMSQAQIQEAISNYASAAARVREAGADGVEITAAKGYLIHQFLNPGINARDDDWGGSADKRFRFLACVVDAVRAAVGKDFLVGVRLSAADHNQDPRLLWWGRLPWHFKPEERRSGSGIDQMRKHALALQDLGVDFLHITAGYGFPNPHDVPGRFPFEEVRMFFDSVRHLSAKASARAALTHVAPTAWLDWLTNIGWKEANAVNLDSANIIKAAVRIPVIVNGGFQDRPDIERALQACDMVSMARALMADPDLPRRLIRREASQVPRCTRCNKCVGRTATSPLGCYDQSRFPSQQAMFEAIMAFNRPDGAPSGSDAQPSEAALPQA
ncbi:NADH:flavin oxidoreductase [Variovorax dokdonensis]|uniref:NADH:flavin oxidoreductase n=1 Tax=Variovorax dokdonensis TaxID=344883 RepID=A0ABT7NE88_9BURK|nr:NADH:flavin oxidoreductase [Variovorax dokdonensis]MDM0046260.1 NADH:flavin oxidoreductase [Variovorax dokdonensis]